MKKKIAFLVLALMLVSAAISAFAAGENTAVLTATAAKSEVSAGEEFNIVISIAERDAKAVQVDLSAIDQNLFEIVSVKENAEVIKGGITKGYDSNTLKLNYAFSANTTIGGEIFTVTLKAKDAVKIGETYTLDINYVVKLKTDKEFNLDIEKVDASVKIPCPGHQWTESDKVATTCMTTGSVKKTCSVCGDVVTEELPVDPTAHDMKQSGDVVASTCTTEGYTPYACANNCGTTEQRDVKAALGHNMVAGAPVEATCTTEGYTPYTCDNNCGTTENREVVDALGHDIAEYTVDKEATCTEEGSQHGVCARCDAEVIVAIPMLEHEWVKGETVAPTADAEGYTEYKCANCDTTKKDDVVAKLEPVVTTDAAKADETTKADDNKKPVKDDGLGDNMIFAVVMLTAVACASAAIIVVRRKKEDR